MEEVIKKGCAVPADFTNPLHAGQHHIAVTFDDGFQSVLNNALPLMRERNIPATIFVPSGYLGKKPGWISDPKSKNADEILLTEHQLKEIPDDLVTFGSHCVTHPRLTEIDECEAFQELIKSKETLEKILQRSITLFSLPHGDYNQRIIELSKEAGYKRIFLNIPTFPYTKIGEYLVGRIDVALDDWLIEYRLKMLGAYQWLPFAVCIKRKNMDIVRKIGNRNGEERG